MNHINFNIDTDVNETEFDDLKEFYEITDSKTIKELMGDMIILERYKNNFDQLYQHTVDICALCWNNVDEDGEKLQHTPVKFKPCEDSEMEFTIPLNSFMLSLPFIRPVIDNIEFIDINEFMVVGPLTKKKREKIQKNVVHCLQKYCETVEEIQEKIADLALELKELLIVFSKADMVIYTSESLFLNYYKKSDVIREINNTEYSSEMQTTDIVAENKKKYELLEAEMIRLNNPYFMANQFTKIIKPKQMEELYINFSQIPDGRNIIPVIMNGNGFKSGYATIPILYAGAIAARVPDIMNKEFMGSAGYFSRNMMILAYGTLSRSVYDCGSKNTLKITIEEDTMDMYDGRYYYPYAGSPTMKVFHPSKDMVGKTLYFRSPCKCNLNEDVCQVCYGSIALKVGNLRGGFIYTTEIVTSSVQHNILKAKHILKADAEPLIFTGKFDDYFTIDNSSIIPKDEKRFDIYIKDDYQEDIANGFTCYIGKDLIPVGISNYASIHIPDEIIDNGKEVVINDITYIKLSSRKILDTGTSTFYDIIPISKSSSAVFMKIMKFFENDVTKFETIDEAAAILTGLFKEADMPVLATHGEIMLSKLLRSADNKLLRPNFLEDDAKYQINRLKNALVNTEASSIGLAFEQTKHHLLHPILDERNKIKRVGPRSFADYMFGEGRI